MKWAYHQTNKEAAQKIIKNGVKASDRGWKGKGLYAYTRSGGREGKGDVKVWFNYSQLKTTDGDKPQEFSDKEWEKARGDRDYYEKLMRKYDYDAEIDDSSSWIKVYPWALDKLEFTLNKPMKFNETINKFKEELINPDREIAYQISSDHKYVWVVVMKKDHFLIEVDGPPVKEREKEDSKLKKAVKYTKDTAMKLLNAVRKRLIEGVEDGTKVLATLQIPFDETDYQDVKESKKFAKEIIQGSRDLYDIKGVISLDEEAIEKYIIG